MVAKKEVTRLRSTCAGSVQVLYLDLLGILLIASEIFCEAWVEITWKNPVLDIAEYFLSELM